MGLERWPSGLGHLFCSFLRTQAQFPAFTWWLAIICNTIAKGAEVLVRLLHRHAHGTPQAHRPNTSAEKINLKRKENVSDLFLEMRKQHLGSRFPPHTAPCFFVFKARSPFCCSDLCSPLCCRSALTGSTHVSCHICLLCGFWEANLQGQG